MPREDLAVLAERVVNTPSPAHKSTLGAQLLAPELFARAIDTSVSRGTRSE